MPFFPVADDIVSVGLVPIRLAASRARYRMHHAFFDALAVAELL